MYFYEVLKNKSIKIILKATVGLVLFLWMAYSLYHQIQRQDNLQSTLHTLFSEWNGTKLMLLSGILLLMVLNWTIEAKKWQWLLIGTESITLWKSLQSVLTGVAVSIMTPNRIGEYMGRILYLRNVHKIQGITVTIVGSFAQLIITGSLGIIGLLAYLIHINQAMWLYILLGSSVVLCIGLIMLYFNLNVLVKLTQRFSLFKKITLYIEVVKRFDQRQLLNILFISFLRYIVYSIQFVLLMKLCLVDISFFTLITTIWLIFWAMAIVPTIAIAEIGIRSETALYFLSPLHTNHVGIISSTILLWLINLIIPALVGCLFVYKMKIYEEE